MNSNYRRRLTWEVDVEELSVWNDRVRCSRTGSGPPVSKEETPGRSGGHDNNHIFTKKINEVHEVELLNLLLFAFFHRCKLKEVKPVLLHVVWVLSLDWKQEDLWWFVTFCDIDNHVNAWFSMSVWATSDISSHSIYTPWFTPAVYP